MFNIFRRKSRGFRKKTKYWDWRRMSFAYRITMAKIQTHAQNM